MKRSRILPLLCLVVFAGGCATSALQTKVAMTRTIVLLPTNKNRTIYIKFQNNALSGMKLKPLLIKKLEDRGYKVVYNIKNALYFVNINILFANNTKEKYAIKNATNLGVVGAVIGSSVKRSFKSGAISGVAAALGAAAVSSATEDEIYEAIIDISVKDKLGLMQKSRIFATARKMNLNLEEAMPSLEDKISTQIAQIF